MPILQVKEKRWTGKGDRKITEFTKATTKRTNEEGKKHKAYFSPQLICQALEIKIQVKERFNKKKESDQFIKAMIIFQALKIKI